LLQYQDLKYEACKGIDLLFYKSKDCLESTTSLKRSELIRYYNELVIHLQIAENLINTSISIEIQDISRAIVEQRQRKVIELLRKNILPLMHIAVSIRLCIALAI